jgi:hypothetical protein
MKSDTTMGKFSGEIFVVASLSLVIAADTINYCTNNTFDSSQSTNYMQFTKETIGREYAVEGQFKALHCCAKGYRSIEW